jgi:RHS repeat-associated protein
MGNLKTLTLGTTRKDSFTYKAGASGSSGLPLLATVTENGTARTLAYDAFGNETSDGKSTFTYSGRELLGTDSRFVSAYYYDALHQRVSTTLSSGAGSRDSFFDQQMRLQAETNTATSAPTIAYKYIWLGSRPVAQVDSGGTHWVFADQLGTPLIQTNSAEAITWQGEYEPFGALFSVRTGATLHQPLRFPGQTSEQFDSGNNGLTERTYNMARWYRYNWSRYSEPDPYGLRAGTDEYAYVRDRPTVKTDPSGLDSPAANNALGQFAPVGINPLNPYNPPPAPQIPPGLANMGKAVMSAPGNYVQNFHFGKYCGQYWTNGQHLDQSNMTPSQIGTVPPDSVADTCCEQHDKDHAKCDTDFRCHQSNSTQKKHCYCRADTTLFNCTGFAPIPNLGRGFQMLQVMGAMGLQFGECL